MASRARLEAIWEAKSAILEPKRARIIPSAAHRPPHRKGRSTSGGKWKSVVIAALKAVRNEVQAASWAASPQNNQESCQTCCCTKLRLRFCVGKCSTAPQHAFGRRPGRSTSIACKRHVGKCAGCNKHSKIQAKGSMSPPKSRSRGSRNLAK